MTYKHPLALFLLASALAAGCQGSPADYDGDLDPVGPSTRERLGARETFALAPMSGEGAGSAVTLQLAGSLVAEPREVTLPVLGGHATARLDADGRLLVEDLEVGLSDIVLDPEAFPPHGLHVTGLTLRLAEQVAADAAWSADEQSVSAGADMDLLLDWAVVMRDGAVHPLATQRIRGVGFQAEVGRVGAAGLRVAVLSTAEGEVWTWGPYVRVSDVVLDLEGASDALP